MYFNSQIKTTFSIQVSPINYPQNIIVKHLKSDLRIRREPLDDKIIFLENVKLYKNYCQNTRQSKGEKIIIVR